MEKQKMYDKKSILAQTLITNSIMRSVYENRNNDKCTVKDMVEGIGKQIGCENKEYLIISPAFILGQFDMVITMIHQERIEELNIYAKDIGLILKEDYKLYYMIRRIRNAIAHDAVKISNNSLFHFKDHYNNTNFELDLSIEQIWTLNDYLIEILAKKKYYLTLCNDKDIIYNEY